MKKLLFFVALLSLYACNHYYYFNSNYISKANLNRDFSFVNSNLHLINSSFTRFAIVVGKDLNKEKSKYIMFCPWANQAKLRNKENLNIDDVYLQRNVVLNEENFEDFKEALNLITQDMSKSVGAKDGIFSNYNFFVRSEPMKENDKVTTF